MTNDLQWDYPDPFVMDIVVSDADIDALGHANNTTYLRWCEEVGWAHSEQVGLDFASWERLNRAVAVHEARLQYIMAVRSGERLHCADWIVKNDGRLRASRHFQFIRANDGKTVFRADLHYVCIELDSGKPRRMPQIFADQYHVLPSVAAVLARTQGS